MPISMQPEADNLKDASPAILSLSADAFLDRDRIEATKRTIHDAVSLGDVIIDLGCVEKFLDVAYMVESIGRGQKRARENGTSLYVAAPSQIIQERLRISRLALIVPCFKSVDDALSYWSMGTPEPLTLDDLRS